MSVRAVRAANFLDELAERERSVGEKSICGGGEGSVCEPETAQPERERVVNELEIAF